MTEILFLSFPIVTTLLLSQLRLRRPLTSYCITSAIILACAIIAWQLSPNVEFQHDGMVKPPGFATIALPVQVISAFLLNLQHSKTLIYRWGLLVVKVIIVVIIAEFHRFILTY